MAGREGDRGRRPPPSELALAAVVTAVMCVDLQQAHSLWLGLLLTVPAGLSLAWRVRVPAVPLALTATANLVLAATASTEFGPQTTFFGVVLALFSAASHLAGRALVVSGALSLVAVVAAHLSTGAGHADDFLPLVVWGLPWLAGRLVRRQALAAREAGARAALLEVEAREATSRERDRIARELHDVVAHSVSLMVVQAGAERLALGSGSARTTAALAAIEGTGRQALAELRGMLGVLRGSGGEVDGLAPQPGLADVPALVDSVRTAGLVVRLDVVGDAAAVGPGPALAAFRVVQESLTNALRHGAGTASVRIAVDRRDVHVEVVNPLGSASTGGGGRGLVGMRERVAAFGGRLDAGPRDGEWVVSAHLPVSSSAPVTA